MKSTKEMQTSNAEMVTISRAEYEKLLGQEQQLLADVNRDGRVTVIDANEILRIDVGL